MKPGIIKAFIGFILGLTAVTLLQLYVFNGVGSSFTSAISMINARNTMKNNTITESSTTGGNDIVTLMVDQINKSCPMNLDKETRLDGAELLASDKVQCNYTLINQERTEVDTTNLKGRLQPVLLENMKTNPSTKALRDGKVTMVYNYRDKNGQSLFKITVSPEQYQD